MMTVLARVATACALLLPAMLLYSRAGTEIAIGIIDAAFLLRSALTRDWAWCRRVWWLATMPYWAWLVLCAVAATDHRAHGLVQALLVGRFFLLAAALAEWVLLPASTRTWIAALFTACAGWIVLECWQQYLFGANIMGEPRWVDGALTGPFFHPRAGPAFLLLFFPAVLPPVLRLLERPHWRSRVAGTALIAVAVTTMVLIGQRMPTLLMAFGLLVTGVVMPRLRIVVLAAVACGATVLAATPIISPPTFAKLGVGFLNQMGHFASSSYGLLYGRAIVITREHPLLGMGFDSFRSTCADPRFFVAGLPTAPADGGGLLGCNLHPHNFYLEAATSAGLPGLVLFALMTTTWLAKLSQHIDRADATRVGLFVTLLLVLWPFGSTSAFYSIPNVGWLFLSLGWSFAELQAVVPAVVPRRIQAISPDRAGIQGHPAP